MRPLTVRLTIVAVIAAFGVALPAAAAPPGTTEPLGPLDRPSPNCVSFDPARSAAPVKPDGWYAIGLSAPGQTLFQLIPKSRLASWSDGLTPAHNDFVGDGFVGRTGSGPQTICLTDSEPIWYQALYDTTGTGPQPPASGPGGGVAFHQYYGWSSEG
jgi:hypothetical protein